mmetsp:Transcript_53315/g.105733  ORF Transcript_53315/g.105733 Transcript_53315/m.105733 type:complete len:260 (-) Transcript_53315:137-916(-)
MVPSNTSCFFSCSCSIFSSTLSLVMNLVACTALSWPMRYARCTACISTAGFHHGSNRNTWLASWRFSPSPPAFRDMRITLMAGLALNAASTDLLSDKGMSPISFTTSTPLSPRSRHSTRSSMVRYWLNTMALSVGSALTRASTALATASTLELVCHEAMSSRCRIEFRPTVTPDPTTGTGLLAATTTAVDDDDDDEEDGVNDVDDVDDDENGSCSTICWFWFWFLALTTWVILARQRGHALVVRRDVHAMQRTMCPHGR